MVPQITVEAGKHSRRYQKIAVLPETEHARSHFRKYSGPGRIGDCPGDKRSTEDICALVVFGDGPVESQACDDREVSR